MTTGTAQASIEVAPAGYEQQFDVVKSGHVWQYKLVTSDATGLNIASGPAILGGIFLIGLVAVIASGAVGRGRRVVFGCRGSLAASGCPHPLCVAAAPGVVGPRRGIDGTAG